MTQEEDAPREAQPVRSAQPERSPQAALDRLALDLVRSAARFTRTVGNVPGSAYSAIAWRVLSDLQSGGPSRVSLLAQQQQVAQPSMTGLVQRLASEGWVDRSPDPDDGRVTLIRITTTGERALGEYRRAAAAKVAPILGQLTAEDRQTLAAAAALMQRLSDGG